MKSPKVRFQNFNDELHEKKLGSIVDIFRGASPRPKADPKFYGGPIPRLMIEDVTRDGKYVTPKVDSLTLEGAKKSRFVTKGSLVLSCSGTRVAIPGILNVDACIHDGFFGFKNFKELDKDYLFYFFEKLHESIQSSATKGATFNNLTTEIMKTMSFVLPSQVEQKKIASFFMIIDKKNKMQQEKIEKLEELKKGMMQKIFSQELRFKDEDGGEFEEWEEKRLNEISTINPKSEQLKNEFYYIDLDAVDKGNIGGLKTVFLENAPSRAQRVLKEKDVLFQTVRPYQQNHFYVENLYDKQTVASTGFAQIRTKQNARYLYYLLHNEIVTKKVMDRCTGTSYPAINSGLLGEISVPVPTLLEQEKISELLSIIDKKIKIEKEKLKTLIDQKKGFMQQMFI